jgi:hypothetical protein
VAAKIIGAKELQRALGEILQNVNDSSLIFERLAVDMSKYAHVVTGYLKSTIYSKDNVVGATAPYAGFEADRGGDHDFAQRAIDAFPMEKYSDEIVRPF